MSEIVYILPPDSLMMVTGAFAGVGALCTAVFVILTVLQTKSAVCKPPEKEDFDKLNAIQGTQVIKEDSGDYMQGGDEPPAQAPSKKKKAKKDV